MFVSLVKKKVQNAIRKAMPRIKSSLNRAKEGVAIRVNALIRALRNNDVPITRGLGSNFGNLNPDYVRNLKKSYNEAKKDIAEGVSKAIPEKVVNDLANYESKRFTFGSEEFILDKSGMTLRCCQIK